MARKTPKTSETLEEIQSAADRLAEWIQRNLKLVGAVVGGLLLLAGLVSFALGSREATEAEASDALAEARTAYLSAMGAAPGSLEVPELANPKAAKRIRDEYQARFRAIADEHAGTIAGALARMEGAQLALDDDDFSAAVTIYEKALEEGTGGDRFRGLLLQRVAQALEDAERWDDAASRHEEAADLTDYPLRHWALADAARCRLQAGDREGANALYGRLAQQAPDLRLPDHQRVQMRELAATSAL